MEQTTTNKTRLTTRVAFIPFQRGIVEASLTASATNFPKLQFQLSQLLGSLQIGSPQAGALKRSQHPSPQLERP